MHVIGVVDEKCNGVPKPERKRKIFRLIRMDKVEELPEEFAAMLKEALS